MNFSILPCRVKVCSDILPRHQFLLRCLSSYQLYSATGAPFGHFATHNATDDGEPSKNINETFFDLQYCCEVGSLLWAVWAMCSVRK